MLVRRFDPTLPYRYVVYLRMSDDKQNPRSPQQQHDEINIRLQRLGLPWKEVKVYTDAAKTGRLIKNRPAYLRMMRELKGGTVAAELILVDTIERFGRIEELQEVRQKLEQRYGVLILSANTNFADPTSPQGRALGMVEAYRAKEDGIVKAHNVFRGKRDCVLLKHWPGGEPPFGFMLKSVMTTENGREIVDYSILVPDPAKSWIIQDLFAKAKETAWGRTRLARYLNDHPRIPDQLKPFQPCTVAYWLGLEIYYGEMVWPKLTSGIVDNALVREDTPAEEILRIPEWCDALITKELWQDVERVRSALRAMHSGGGPKKDGAQRLIEPTARGLVMTYLLTGLVTCGICKRAMRPSSSTAYTTKEGKTNNYAAYLCPGYVGGFCANGTRIEEAWLREAVLDRLKSHLFPQ